MITRTEVFGDATLHLGDTMAALDLMPVVACIVTDPPFGIDYRSGYATEALWAGGDKIEGDADVRVRDWAVTWSQYRRIPALVFGSWRAPRPPHVRARLIWDKGGALGMGALDIPWKPGAEEIYVIGHGWVGSRDCGDVLRCPPVQSMARNGRLHPNEKPVRLIEMLLRKCPAGAVLDPFMGSASTAEACLRAGRAFVGIEIVPEYFDIACRRMERLCRQGELVAEGSRL